MSLAPLQKSFGTITGKAHYLTFSGAVCFPLLVLWFITALYLGKAFQKAVKDKKIIC